MLRSTSHRILLCRGAILHVARTVMRYDGVQCVFIQKSVVFAHTSMTWYDMIWHDMICHDPMSCQVDYMNAIVVARRKGEEIPCKLKTWLWPLWHMPKQQTGFIPSFCDYLSVYISMYLPMYLSTMIRKWSLEQQMPSSQETRCTNQILEVCHRLKHLELCWSLS